MVVTETETYYTGPFIGEGSSVTLSCAAGLELVGSNITTCTRSGEWKPDPGHIECRGYN